MNAVSTTHSSDKLEAEKKKKSQHKGLHVWVEVTKRCQNKWGRESKCIYLQDWGTKYQVSDEWFPVRDKQNKKQQGMQIFYSKNKQLKKHHRKKWIKGILESSLEKKEKTFQLVTTAHSQGNQRKSEFHVTMEKPAKWQECEQSEARKDRKEAIMFITEAASSGVNRAENNL